MSSEPVIKVEIKKVRNGVLHTRADLLVSEQPLEITIRHGSYGNRRSFSLAITMRTPGDDQALALGFLLTENIILQADDIVAFRPLSDDRILIDLDPSVFFNELEMHRHVYTSSSCGVCGKASLESVEMAVPYILKKGSFAVTPDIVSQWPDKIMGQQSLFHQTGGIHAAGLFARDQLLYLKEDVGRHNAMDKLIGAAMNSESMPMDGKAVMVSGRASFELVQKALMAGIPLLAAVGAPSSLAVELADQHNMTLIGFVRNDQFNVYCGAERIQTY